MAKGKKHKHSFELVGAYEQTRPGLDAFGKDTGRDRSDGVLVIQRCKCGFVKKELVKND